MPLVRSPTTRARHSWTGSLLKARVSKEDLPRIACAQGGQWRRSKTGVESDSLRVHGAAAKVRRARLPHEELAGFAKHFEKVSKAQEKGRAVYSGDLTDAAVKQLAPAEFRPVARSGQARIWVSGGQVTK